MLQNILNIYKWNIIGHMYRIHDILIISHSIFLTLTLNLLCYKHLLTLLGLCVWVCVWVCVCECECVSACHLLQQLHFDFLTSKHHKCTDTQQNKVQLHKLWRVRRTQGQRCLSVVLSLMINSLNSENDSLSCRLLGFQSYLLHFSPCFKIKLKFVKPTHRSWHMVYCCLVWSVSVTDVNLNEIFYKHRRHEWTDGGSVGSTASVFPSGPWCWRVNLIRSFTLQMKVMWYWPTLINCSNLQGNQITCVCVCYTVWFSAFSFPLQHKRLWIEIHLNHSL